MADQAKNARTAERKARNVARQEKLAARPGDEVSENCRKSRGKRARKREFQAAWKRANAKERKGMVSPTEAGRRQFRHAQDQARIELVDES